MSVAAFFGAPHGHLDIYLVSETSFWYFLRMVPAVWGNITTITRYETFIIRTERPKFQRTQRSIKTNLDTRERPFPRFRKPKKTSQEIDLNQTKRFSCAKSTLDKQYGIPENVQTFYECVQHVSKVGITEREVKEKMYTHQGCIFFMFWLSEHSTRICYKRLWQMKRILKFVLSTWSMALKIPGYRMRRVHRKIERFLNTSGLFPTRLHTLRIPAHSDFTIQKAKKTFLFFLRTLRTHLPDFILKFLRFRFKVLRTRGPRVFDLLENHITLAKNFEKRSIQAITDQDKIRYDARKDAFKFQFDFARPVGQKNEVVQKAMCDFLQQWTEDVKLGDIWKFEKIHNPNRRQAPQARPQDFFTNIDAFLGRPMKKQHNFFGPQIAWLRCNSTDSSPASSARAQLESQLALTVELQQSDTLSGFVDVFRKIVQSTTYVTPIESLYIVDQKSLPVANYQIVAQQDKDPRRGILQEKAGYLWRLYSGFARDEQFFKELQGVSVDDLCSWRRECHSRILPAITPKREYNIVDVPYCYHNYKSKCVGPQGGLICGKKHAHEREVVSDMHHPLKRHMQRCARAVRLTKKLLNDPTWTLWSMAELVPCFRKK